jgi:hypothetical protein
MAMSLGVGALVAPVGISDAALLDVPLVVMLVLLAVAILLALRSRHLARRDSYLLFAGTPIFVVAATS